MHKYQDPKKVLSPKDCISDVNVIFDGQIHNGGYSLAIVKWKGEQKIAMRWNINQREWDDQNKKNGTIICIGEPNSRGYSTWFIHPNPFLQSLISGKGEILEAIKESLKLIELENI